MCVSACCAAAQVLRYTKGQQYEGHYDDAYDNSTEGGPHHRMMTFYMYLSGETRDACAQ